MQTFPSDQALLDHLETHRIPVAPVVDPADAHTDEWFWERGALTTVDDPVHGRLNVPGLPIRGSNVPKREVEPPAPLLGEHNAQVLSEVLGYDEERVAALIADGVLLASEQG